MTGEEVPDTKYLVQYSGTPWLYYLAAANALLAFGTGAFP